MAKAKAFIDLMHQAGYSLESLGQAVKIHPTALSHISAGRRNVRFDRAMKIAKVLRVTPEVLQQSFRRAG